MSNQQPTTSVDNLSPEFNDWYKGDGEYRGRATIQMPSGKQFEGDGTVKWDDTGECETELTLTPFTAADEVMDGDFVELSVRTTGGVYSAPRAIAFSSSASFGPDQSEATVKLHAAESEFTPAGTRAAEFWAVPVCNLISDFNYRSPETDRHILRLFRTPPVPTGPSENVLLRRAIFANSKNKLILFRFLNKPGFVEPLPEYSEKKSQLENRKADCAATAIMVGSVPAGTSVAMGDVRRWFPFDYCHALSVASGADVGIGFIELRGADSALVKRIHVSTAAKYVAGTRVLHELFAQAKASPTGILMERCLATFAGKSHLRPTAKYLVEAGTHSVVIENAVASLVRGFEALTTAEGLATQNLLDGIGPAAQQKVRTALQAAADEIRAEGTVAKNAGNGAAADRLARIADRALGASQREAMFGLAVSDLLKSAGLKDESAVNAFLATQSPATTWAAKLSNIRGAVIHRGFVDIRSRDDLLSMHSYIRHLHDVLVRLFLIRVGYDGTYQPSVAEWVGTMKPLDWVQETTPVAELRLT